MTAEERARFGVIGLRVLGAVELGTALFRLAAEGASAGAVAVAAVGALTSIATAVRWLARWVRPVAMVSVWLAAAVLARVTPLPAEYVLAGNILFVLVAVACVPLRPLETLGLGLAVAVTAGSHIPSLLVLTIIAAGLSSVFRCRRRHELRAHDEAVRVGKTLAGAQLRAQLAENASAIGKLAASLKHEINTPLGTLKSSISSLLVLAARQGGGSSVETELRQSIEASAERLESVVSRLERFISLAEAETKPANLNDLLTDVTVLLEPRIRGIDLRLDLHPLPSLNCRPQLLMLVFSSLLSNALNAVNGQGRIEITTRLAESAVEVSISDNGRGMPAEEVDTIFDPGFRVADARVSSANWSLFNVRQIVYQHGGDIQIESEEGRGTRVCVCIPF